jgi:hypothetical protein
MNFYRRILFQLLFSLTVLGISAVEKLEAPFVSNLQAVSSGGKVLLTWSNPIDFKEDIIVYRSTRMMSKPTRLLTATRLTTLKNGEEKYIDTPPPGSYFYAVIISSKSDNTSKLVLVPFRNYSLNAVEITNTDLYKITSFDAESSETSITLQWKYTSESTELTNVNIYRNTVPIKQKKDLDTSIKIANLTINTGLFVDIPIANIEYFYAIFIDGDPNKQYTPGVSITTDPLSIARKKETMADFSIDTFIPLPLITLTNDPKSGKMFLDPQLLKSPRKIDYTPEVAELINQSRSNNIEIYNRYMQSVAAKSTPPGIHILEDEEVYDAGDYGPEYVNAVSLIKRENLGSALAILEELITENLNEQFLERVSFYIGQIYFANGDYHTAYIHLAMAYSGYRKAVLPYLSVIHWQIFSQMER